MTTFAQLGYWKVGGPIERFETVADAQRLASLVREAGQIRGQESGSGLFVLGNGSNLLVSDSGLPGTTIRLAGEFKAAEVLEVRGDDVHLRVGAGLLNAVLLNRYLGKLSGLAPLVGVPGTMGGAVAMNAGTALGEIGDVLLRVEGVDNTGALRVIERADLAVRYREGGLPAGFVVTAAVLRLCTLGANEERTRAHQHLLRRKATQPLDLPSCGSVFRNPPPIEGCPVRAAGQLIEAVGLKGWRCGGAQISEKHANFIVNLGNAKATDVMMCIQQAYRTVSEQTAIRLTPEVHVLGRWEKNLWPLPPVSE